MGIIIGKIRSKVNRRFDVPNIKVHKMSELLEELSFEYH